VLRGNWSDHPYISWYWGLCVQSLFLLTITYYFWSLILYNNMVVAHSLWWWEGLMDILSNLLLLLHWVGLRSCWVYILWVWLNCVLDCLTVAKFGCLSKILYCFVLQIIISGQSPFFFIYITVWTFIKDYSRLWTLLSVLALSTVTRTTVWCQKWDTLGIEK
jgi:hypothetical protein